MRNGAVKIEFVDGEIKRAHTNPGLGAFYERMFKGAKRRAKRRPDKVENGIQVIVFGTFLLEAVCNDRYRTFLSCMIQHRGLADGIWSVTKRSAMSEKISVAIAVGSLSGTKIDGEMMKKLKLPFDLRNRLAHFKDSDTVWDAPADFISDPENWSKAPDPELMGHLANRELFGYISDIDTLLAWFDKVFRVRKKTVKSLVG
jgi:hypothetical protein